MCARCSDAKSPSARRKTGCISRQLLATTDECIDEIVCLTGFSEPGTFYRAFKRWSGMALIEYRKTAQGKVAMVDAM